MLTKETKELEKPCYEAIKKISKGKWEWKPEKWEMVVYENKVDVITGHSRSPVHVHLSSKPGVHIKDLLPLLHWERIREIMLYLG